MKLRITQQNEAVHFYGHGKLLLTGEYFVIDGAKALSLPTRFGQSLRVQQFHSSESILYWVALNNQNQQWLNLVFDSTDFSCINGGSDEAMRLSKILNTVRELNPDFLSHKKDTAVETHLEFPNEWGLGSSSTLIHCISKWAGVDGYELLKATLGGSGYDVAAAAHNSPVFYQLQNGKPETLPLHWRPPYSDKIYFAYLGKKQLSSEAINYYKNQLQSKTHTIAELTRISELVIKSETLESFEELINEHETIIGSQLKLMKLKDTVFGDYWGSVKSLGAWGGDFVLLTNTRSRLELTDYLKQKNIDTVFSWEEIILAPQSV